MRTTFSCVLCVLLVAACWDKASSKHSNSASLLKQAINHLDSLIKKDYGIFLHSPTHSIQECCSQSAFDCFREELNTTFLRKLNISDYKSEKLRTEKLSRNLKKPSILNSVKTCTDEEIKKVSCMPCSSYPKVNSKEFIGNLQSFLQKAYSRL